MLEKIKELVVDNLGVNADEVVETASFKDDLQADSLDLYQLMLAIEEEFDVEIPSEELENIATVGDVIKYIEAHQ